jgi:hypothetical protein
VEKTQDPDKKVASHSPLQAKPAQLAGWIRGHWAIENKIRWVRDVTYDEDRSQIRAGTGQQVMAALRNAAIGALRLAGVTNIAAANHHHARDSTRPLALPGIIGKSTPWPRRVLIWPPIVLGPEVSTRGGRLLLAWRAGERLRVQRPPARSRVRGGESDADESMWVSAVRPAAIGACPRWTGRRCRRPVIHATRTTEMLGQQFHLPVRREPGRRPLRVGPELRGRLG